MLFFCEIVCWEILFAVYNLAAEKKAGNIVIRVINFQLSFLFVFHGSGILNVSGKL
jgi:hypothetical protein